MTVLGVAGPGDPLANPAKTFKTCLLYTSPGCQVEQTRGLRLDPAGLLHGLDEAVTLGQLIAANRRAVPVSYTHLDVYKRQE